MYVNDETLVDFISDTFGSNYGYIYYDLTDKLIRPAKVLGIGNPAVIKSANEVARGVLHNYDASRDYVDYTSSESGVRYRILFLKGQDEVTGVLMVVDNVERKRQLLTELENYLQVEPLPRNSASQNFEKPEEIKSLSELGGLVRFLIEQTGRRSAAELDPNEKIRIVKELKKRGVFKFKGAIGMAAPLLNISTPTIYRYLSQLDEHQTDVENGLMPEENIRLI